MTGKERECLELRACQLERGVYDLHELYWFDISTDGRLVPTHHVDSDEELFKRFDLARNLAGVKKRFKKSLDRKLVFMIGIFMSALMFVYILNDILVYYGHGIYY